METYFSGRLEEPKILQTDLQINDINTFIIWLAPRMGKMKRILCSDWLPKWARWAYLARSGLPALFPQKRNSLVYFWPDNKSFIDQACSVKMAGYWPRSFLRFYGRKKRKKRTQLDQYPAILSEQAWSITRIYKTCNRVQSDIET